MNLIVTGRHVEITSHIEEYIEKKLEKVERHLPHVNEVRAEMVYRETRSADDRYKFQLTIWDGRQILRSEVSTGDIFASIDAGIEKILRQVERVEGRRKNRRRRASVAENAQAVVAAMVAQEEQAFAGDEVEDEHGQIVRRKEFVAQPMTAEEAQEQMELLGHDFFLFLNPDENAINLIYRRQDGNFGLLQPQVL